MKSIKVEILGKQYPLKVEDDEVESMQKIASFVDDRFRTFKQDLAKQPDTTAMALASLSIAEELFEERMKKSATREQEENIYRNVNSVLEEIKSQLPEGES